MLFSVSKFHPRVRLSSKYFFACSFLKVHGFPLCSNSFACAEKFNSNDSIKIVELVKGCGDAMTERKRETPWFWYLLAIEFLYLLASRFEPLKTINEMYPFPNTFSAHVVVVFILIISAAVWFTLAFRKGRAIRKEIIAKRKMCSACYTDTRLIEPN